MILVWAQNGLGVISVIVLFSPLAGARQAHICAVFLVEYLKELL